MWNVEFGMNNTLIPNSEFHIPQYKSNLLLGQKKITNGI